MTLPLMLDVFRAAMDLSLSARQYLVYVERAVGSTDVSILAIAKHALRAKSKLLSESEFRNLVDDINSSNTLRVLAEYLSYVAAFGFWSNQERCRLSNAKLVEAIMWLVMNNSEDTILCDSFVSGLDKSHYLKLASMWRFALQCHPACPWAARNAAFFFRYHDLSFAIKLMNECVAAEPGEVQWKTDLEILKNDTGTHSELD